MFAALNVLTGKVIGRHGGLIGQEFLKFLRRLNRAFPPDLTLHVTLDNYGTHKHERCQLAGRPSALSAALHADQRLVAQLGQERRAAPSARGLSVQASCSKDYLRHHRGEGGYHPAIPTNVCV